MRNTSIALLGFIAVLVSAPAQAAGRMSKPVTQLFGKNYRVRALVQINGRAPHAFRLQWRAAKRRARAQFRMHAPPGMIGLRSVVGCPLLAQSGHAELHCTCPLLGVKRTCPFALHMSAYDPKRTSAASDTVCAIPTAQVRKVLGFRYCARRGPPEGTCNGASSSRFSAARRSRGRSRRARSSRRCR